ncbi:MAG: hypothetical protein HY360_19060 [Verrucomicrobia bacterium]|nr:hypothetical protein [Verrucomicrobiota bacterium]
MIHTRLFVIILMVLGLTLTLRAEKATTLQMLARMPVKEITVFKDGHAFVLHNGRLPTDAAGNVVIDYLPCPVLGTFWPYCAEKKAVLSAVTASQHKVRVERTALELRELIEANMGASVVVTEAAASEKETAPTSYPATILELLARSGEELEATSPPNSGQKLPQKGNLVLLKTADGVKAVHLDRIRDITFKQTHKRAVNEEEMRNLLTLKLDWKDGKSQKEADVGLLYLQRGIRWIPEYKIVIDGNGNAVVRLQATLINELCDLEEVTAHLVIGVPTFAFKDTVDPMSLQQAAAQLSQHFRQDARTAYGFSNAIMTQQISVPRNAPPPEDAEVRGMDLGPEMADSGKKEDLFIFTMNRISLRKGERMVFPISEFKVKYRDVYVLDIPYAPPPEVVHGFNNEQQAELARLYFAPKVTHKVRLTNTSDAPLTTAPALILRGDRVLAQGMMTYTSPNAESDLDITTAVDIRVKKSDTETKRTPNAVHWQGDDYGRIDLEGKITLTGFARKPVEVEVVRQLLGSVDTIGNGGKVEMVNVYEDASFIANSSRPYWWGWWSWPYWWHHFNGVGRITWTANLEPGKPVDLDYTWHYFWR